MGVPLPSVPDALLGSAPARPLPDLVSARQLRAEALGRTLRLWVPAGFLILLFCACFIWPHIYPVPSPVNASILDPNYIANAPPFTPGHIFGTDPVGNDVFSRILYGGQISFEVGFAVTGIGVAVGGLIGICAAYWGGVVDAVLMRVVDILIAFPALVIAVVIAEALGPSEPDVIWALCAFSIPASARIARGATLEIRELPFMVAARLSGTRSWRMIARHVVPNIIPPIATFSLLGVGVIVILEGALSYLGYGIQLPQPSWGNMIFQGSTTISQSIVPALIPSCFLLAMVVSLNTLGDALRERWGVQ